MSSLQRCTNRLQNHWFTSLVLILSGISGLTAIPFFLIQSHWRTVDLKTQEASKKVIKEGEIQKSDSKGQQSQEISNEASIETNSAMIADIGDTFGKKSATVLNAKTRSKTLVAGASTVREDRHWELIEELHSGTREEYDRDKVTKKDNSN